LQRLIVSAGITFSIIENPILKEIIERGFPNKKLMSRPTLMKRIEIDYKSLMNQIKADMSNCFHIATTADARSIFKKYFIIVFILLFVIR